MSKRLIYLLFSLSFVSLLSLVIFIPLAVQASLPMLASPAAPAATITVNSALDLLNSGDCSLREAIWAANMDMAVDGCAAGSGPDTIVFSLPAGVTITLASGQLPIITDTLTIDGSSAVSLTISGNNASRVLEIDSGTSVTITTLTIADGYLFPDSFCPEYCGAGIYNAGSLRVDGVTLSNNSTTYNGGGIANFGTLEVYDSLFSDNSTGLSNGGGGIYNSPDSTLTVSNSTFKDNFAYQGGGISNYVAGTLTVMNSTFFNNVTEFDGGGIFNLGEANVANSTFSDNGLGGGFFNTYNGGGISNYFTLTVTNSTFSDNAATNAGAGIYNNGTLYFTNTIVANSTAGGDCVNAGTIVTNIANFIEDGSCNPALSGDALIGPLQDNGGPTLTHAPQPGSPAIDAGDNGNCEPVDQRGFARPIDGDSNGVVRCDIGAVEVDAPIENLQASNDSPTLLGEPTTLTATVSAGSNVRFTWDFGDGTSGSGPVVSHTYPTAGIYTAVVTATNSVSSATASTTVTITAPIVSWSQLLPVIRK